MWSRFLGLMGRRELPEEHCLYLRPASSIHMFFMRFPIDAVFLDADGRVLRVYERLRPWRVTRVVRKAKACVELAAGRSSHFALQRGERLQLVMRNQPSAG